MQEVAAAERPLGGPLGPAALVAVEMQGPEEETTLDHLEQPI